MSTPPVLRIFNPQANNRITCDASRIGLGVCYYQQDPTTRKFHPVAFASRKLKPSEASLPIYYLECTALVFAFVKFGHYLQNLNVETEVHTDHESLRTLLATKSPTGALAKYVMFLSQYKFTIKYRKGKFNEADTLSRFPVDDPKLSVEELVDFRMADRVEADQLQASVVSHDSLVISAVTRGQAAKEQETANRLEKLNKDISETLKKLQNSVETPNIHKLQQEDPHIQTVRQNMINHSHKSTAYQIHNELLYYNYRGTLLFVVPQQYQKHILFEFHDMRGHKAVKNTLLAILGQFYWESVRKDTRVYCQSCKYCQPHKKDRLKVGLLKPLIPKRPFSNIACDFIGAFPLSENKNQHACVIVDSYTKFLVAVPVKTPDSATAISCLESFMIRYGVPESFVSDGASYFNSVTLQKALEKFQIEGRHFRQTPHCNGQVEKSIQNLKNILAQLLLEFGQTWETHLQLSVFLYNVSYNDTIQSSPFFALHGYHPVTPGVLQLLAQGHTGEDIQEKISRHADLIKNVKVRIKKSQAKYKKGFDKGRVHAKFKIGQRVKVKNESGDTSFPNKKIAWQGPFKIVGQRSDRFYFVIRTVRTASGKRKFVVKEYHIRNIRQYVKRPSHLKISRNSSQQITNIDSPARQKFQMEHLHGDLLDAPRHFCLAHCVSQDLKLGAGVARTIQSAYSVREELSRQDHSVGAAVLTTRGGRAVYNLVTKNRFFDKPAYNALENCLRELKEQMLWNGHYYLAIPEIGCGRDGLHLPLVIQMIEGIFWNTNIQIVMCHWSPTWERVTPQGLHLC